MGAIRLNALLRKDKVRWREIAIGYNIVNDIPGFDRSLISPASSKVRGTGPLCDAARSGFSLLQVDLNCDLPLERVPRYLLQGPNE